MKIELKTIRTTLCPQPAPRGKYCFHKEKQMKESLTGADCTCFCNGNGSGGFFENAVTITKLKN